MIRGPYEKKVLLKIKYGRRAALRERLRRRPPYLAVVDCHGQVLHLSAVLSLAAAAWVGDTRWGGGKTPRQAVLAAISQWRVA